MQSNWNGLFLAEPRWKLALVFAITGILLQVGLSLAGKPSLTSALNLAYFISLLVALQQTTNVMHPASPILNSDAWRIQLFFFGLVLLTLLLPGKLHDGGTSLSQIAFSDKAELKRTLNFQVTIFVIVRLVFNTFYRMIYPFLSYFAKGLGVDLRTISYAITTRSLMGLIGPFLASVADSRGRKAGMLIGTIAYTAAISLIALWPTFPAFFIALSLAFIGYLIFVPSMQAYLGDQVPYEKRGQGIGDH